MLASHAEAFVAFSNANYGTRLTPEDYREEWSKLWKVGPEEVERRANEFNKAEAIGSFSVKKQALPALQSLNNDYALCIVTARRQMAVETTMGWLDNHFPDIFKGVYFVPIWEPDNTVTKADICQEIGADFLIDDLPRHCNLAAARGIEAILFGSYSWNRDEETVAGVTRCKDWTKVLRYFAMMDV